MAFGLSLVERINRARADLRLGVPIVLTGPNGAALVMAAETATADRLDALREPGLVLAITRYRAETLKARPYDGDLARIIVPHDGGLSGWPPWPTPQIIWVTLLKGSVSSCARDGKPDLHPLPPIALVKTPQLLPRRWCWRTLPPGLIDGDRAD